MNSRDMKEQSTKRMIRIEKKKKKMAALLQITRINECDRLKSLPMRNEDVNSEIEPTPKRSRTEITEELGVNEELDIGSSGKVKLHGEDFVKLKQMLRAQTKKVRAQPKFRLREIGEAASLNCNIEDRIPLFLSDIQHLLLFSQIGHHSPYSPARWCQLEKFTKLKNTTMLIVENVSLYHYQFYESSFTYLTENFPIKLEVITPGAYKTDIVQDFATIPLTGTQMRKFVNHFGSLEEAVSQSPDLFDHIRDLFPLENKDENSSPSSLPNGDKFPRTHLLLSGWQMVEENFPLPIKGLMESKYAEYVLTKERYEDVTVHSPMFGIDCEMCRTTSGDLELTRVSVVNEEYKVIYEELVKPYNSITDYLTKFSGITPKMMKNVVKRLQNVQEDLQKLLPANAILVGQSLSNDLHALKMMHPYVIDTSVIYNITGDRMRKTKLQTLMYEFLGERIQEGRTGHCSIEDSSACLKLAKHKLSQNIYYGDAVMADIATHVKHHPELGHPSYATSMFKQITKMEKTANIVSLEDITSKYHFYTYKDKKLSKKINFTSEKNNSSIVKQICSLTDQYSLSIGHTRVANSQIENNGTNIFKEIDEWIANIHKATVAPGLCIVMFTGHMESSNGCCFISLTELF